MSKLLKVAAGLVALVSLALPISANDARQAAGDTTATQMKVYYDTGATEAKDGTTMASTNVNGNAVTITVIALDAAGKVARDATTGGTLLRAAVSTVEGVVDANPSGIVGSGVGSAIAAVNEGDAYQGAEGVYALKPLSPQTFVLSTASYYNSAKAHYASVKSVLSSSATVVTWNNTAATSGAFSVAAGNYIIPSTSNEKFYKVESVTVSGGATTLIVDQSFTFLNADIAGKALNGAGDNDSVDVTEMTATDVFNAFSDQQKRDTLKYYANNVSGAGSIDAQTIVNNEDSTSGWNILDGVASTAINSGYGKLANLKSTGVINLTNGIGATNVIYTTAKSVAVTDTVTVQLQKRYQSATAGYLVDPIGDPATIKVVVNPAKYDADSFKLSSLYSVTATTDPDKDGSATTPTAGLGGGKFVVRAMKGGPAGTNAAFVGTVKATISYQTTNTQYVGGDATYTASFDLTAEMKQVSVDGIYEATFEVPSDKLKAAGLWDIAVEATINGKTIKTAHNAAMNNDGVTYNTSWFATNMQGAQSNVGYTIGGIVVKARPYDETKYKWAAKTKIDFKTLPKYNFASVTANPAQPRITIQLVDDFGNLVQDNEGTRLNNSRNDVLYVSETCTPAENFSDRDVDLKMTATMGATTVTFNGTNNDPIRATTAETVLPLNVDLSTASSLIIALGLNTDVNEKSITMPANLDGFSFKNFATVATVLLNTDDGTEITPVPTVATLNGAGHGDGVDGVNKSDKNEYTGFTYTQSWGSASVPAYGNLLKVGYDYGAATLYDGSTDVATYGGGVPTAWTPVKGQTAFNSKSIMVATSGAFGTEADAVAATALKITTPAGGTNKTITLVFTKGTQKLDAGVDYNGQLVALVDATAGAADYSEGAVYSAFAALASNATLYTGAGGAVGNEANYATTLAGHVASGKVLSDYISIKPTLIGGHCYLIISSTTDEVLTYADTGADGAANNANVDGVALTTAEAAAGFGTSSTVAAATLTALGDVDNDNEYMLLTTGVGTSTMTRIAVVFDSNNTLPNLSSVGADYILPIRSILASAINPAFGSLTASTSLYLADGSGTSTKTVGDFFIIMSQVANTSVKLTAKDGYMAINKIGLTTAADITVTAAAGGTVAVAPVTANGNYFDVPFANETKMVVQLYKSSDAIMGNVDDKLVTTLGSDDSVKCDSFAADNLAASLVADAGIIRNLTFPMEMCAAASTFWYAIIYPKDNTYSPTRIVLLDRSGAAKAFTSGSDAASIREANGEEANSYYDSIDSVGAGEGHAVNVTAKVRPYTCELNSARVDKYAVNTTTNELYFTTHTGVDTFFVFKDRAGQKFTSTYPTEDTAANIINGMSPKIKITVASAKGADCKIQYYSTNGNALRTYTSAGVTLDGSGTVTERSTIDALYFKFSYAKTAAGTQDTLTFNVTDMFNGNSSTSLTLTTTVTDTSTDISDIKVVGQTTCAANAELLLRVYALTSAGKMVDSSTNQIVIKNIDSSLTIYDNRRGASSWNGAAGQKFANNEIGVTASDVNDSIRLLTLKAPSTAGKYKIVFSNVAGTKSSEYELTVEETTTAGAVLASGTGTSIVPSITITSADSATTVNKGATLALTATTANLSSGTENYVWNTLDSAKATVSTTGVVTGVAAGEATITATGATSAAVGTFKVTVVDPTAPVVTVTPATASIAVNDTTLLSAGTTVSGTATTEQYTWTSSDDTVAGVLANGSVTGLKAGTATITATGKTTGGKGTATITVTAAPAATVAVTPATASIEVGATTTLTAATTGATDASYTWTSSDTAVATVTSAGVVEGIAAGTATITAKGATSAAEGTATITVTAAPVSTTTSLYCPFVYKLAGTGNASVVVNVANIGTVDVTDLTVKLVSGGSNTGVNLAAGKSTQIDLTAISTMTEIDAFVLSYKSTAAADIIAEAHSTLVPFKLSLASPVQAAVSTATASSFWWNQAPFLSLGFIFNPGATTATYNVSVAGAASQTVTVAAGKIGMFSGDGMGAVRIEPVGTSSYVATSFVTNLSGIMAPFTFNAGATAVKGGMTSSSDLVSVAAATSAATTANSVSLGSAGMNFVAATGSVTADAAIVADQLHFVNDAVAVLPMSSSATVAGATFASGMKLVIYNAGTTAANLTITLYGASATDSKTVTVPAGASVEKTVTSTTVAKGAWVISGADDIYATGYGVANDTLYTSAGQ